MPKGMTQKTGSAPIKRMGQTTDGKYGNQVEAKAKGRSAPRDLKMK